MRQITIILLIMFSLGCVQIKVSRTHKKLAKPIKSLGSLNSYKVQHPQEYDPKSIVLILNIVNRGSTLQFDISNGFVINDGKYIVTTCHSVSNYGDLHKNTPESSLLIFSTFYGDIFESKVLAFDQELDLAVLESPWISHPSLIMADDRAIQNALVYKVAAYDFESTKSQSSSQPALIQFNARRPRGDELRAQGKLFSKCQPGRGWSGGPFLIQNSNLVAGVFSRKSLELNLNPFRIWCPVKVDLILQGCRAESVQSFLNKIDSKESNRKTLLDTINIKKNEASDQLMLSLFYFMSCCKYSDALKCVNELNEINLYSSQMLVLKGWCALVCKDLNLARNSYEYAHKIEPQSRNVKHLGNVLDSLTAGSFGDSLLY